MGHVFVDMIGSTTILVDHQTLVGHAEVTFADEPLPTTRRRLLSQPERYDVSAAAHLQDGVHVFEGTGCVKNKVIHGSEDSLEACIHLVFCYDVVTKEVFEKADDGGSGFVGAVFDGDDDSFVDDLVVEMGNVQVRDAAFRLFKII